MMNLAQSVLPFKIEATEERLTANAGLALFGEFIRGVGLGRWLATEMPQPGSARRKLHVPRPTSSITVKTRARPSPSADGWMPRPYRPLPRFPNPPGKRTLTAPSPKPCAA